MNQFIGAQRHLSYGVYFLLAVLLNGTIPFFLGADLHAWANPT
jgi:hypothetical protein